MRRLGLTLNALRSFEAVARHGSFKAAAQELGVTASAVSHQVALLERQLGARLLERDARRVELTPYGAAMLPKLSAGFDLLSEAVADHTSRIKDGPLRISVLDTFALYWLLPRMERCPLGRGIDILTSPRAVSFETENVDMAMRLGHGRWPRVEADKLFDETMSLFVQPGRCALLETGPVFIAPRRREEWDDWRAACAPDLPDLPLVEVDSTALAIKAAIDGAGLGFAGCELVAREVSTGRLAPVAPGTVRSRWGGYWLVYPKLVLRDPRARELRAWLLEEAALSTAAA